jgi:S-adenosylmethionine/arginine decarboxylase-like enzyme
MMGDAITLAIDGCTRMPLERRQISLWLRECPKAIGMTALMKPYIKQTLLGWTGIVIIAESHITITTHGLSAWITIASCKPFPAAEALLWTVSELGLEDVGTQTIEWGWGRRNPA